MTPESLARLANALPVDKDRLKFKMVCSDGTTLYPAGIDELLSFPNPKSREISKIEISTPYSDKSRCEIGFSNDPLWPVTYTVSGEDSYVVSTSDIIEQHIESMISSGQHRISNSFFLHEFAGPALGGGATVITGIGLLSCLIIFVQHKHFYFNSSVIVSGCESGLVFFFGLVLLAVAIKLDRLIRYFFPNVSFLYARYVYDLNGMLLEETNAAGAAQADYIYLNGQPVAVLSGSTLYDLHTDHLGTPQFATNSSQVKEWTFTYAPFGDAATTAGTITQNLRLPGQYFDSETGWNHNGFRDYAPNWGRYIESDPLGQFGDSYSPYVYANSNPLMYIDPFGLCWVYRQSTGQLTHIDANGNVDYTANGGYSGYGQGLNNPAMQSVQSRQPGDPAGPIPQGPYSIGAPHYSPNTGPMTMNLSPIDGNNALGRTLLRIHGDNAAHNHTASTGCIIEGPNVRNRIANSNDNCLEVVP